MQAGFSAQDELHVDLKRATKGLMLSSNDLEEATGVRDWNMPSGVPRFGSLLEEKDRLFLRCRGTAIGTMDWSANGLFVADVRLVFESETDCLAYYRSSIAHHAELVHQDSSGCYPRMMEVQPNQEFLLGIEPRLFCGPSPAARQRLMLSLTAGRSKEEADHLVRLAEKAVHLVYLFCTGRVMCKLRVTTHTGVMPLVTTHAVALHAKRRADHWLSSGEECLYGKAELRRALRERAQQRRVGEETETPSTPSSQHTTPHALPNAHNNHWYSHDAGPGGAEQELCVFAVGEGEVRGGAGVRRQLGRLLEGRGRGRGEEGVEVRAVAAGSEEGRAVQGYAAAHRSQRPAPLVLLCGRLAVRGPAGLAAEAREQAEQTVGDVVWEHSAGPAAPALRGRAGPCPDQLQPLRDTIRALSPLLLRPRPATRPAPRPGLGSLPSLLEACWAAREDAEHKDDDNNKESREEGDHGGGGGGAPGGEGGGAGGWLRELARHACLLAEIEGEGAAAEGEGRCKRAAEDSADARCVRAKAE